MSLLKHKYANSIIFGLFLLAAIVARFFIFFPSVIDHDESTYILIADQLLNGKIPYVDSIEIKPIGIFLFFAAALKFIGNSIFSIRLLTVVIIAATAFFLYRAKALLIEKKYALLVGFAYIVMTSLHKWTWSPNTEVYFNMFTAIGIYILLSSKTPLHYFLLGFVMGMGFIVKYMVVFEMAAFGLYFLISHGIKKDWKIIITSVPLMVFGFFIPFGWVTLSYYMLGYWDEYVFATFTIPFNYSSTPDVGRYFEKFFEILLAYLPLSLLFLATLVGFARKQIAEVPYRILAFSWFVFVWIAIYLPGKFPHHYALQAVLPMAFFMVDIFNKEGWIRKHIKPLYLYGVMGVMLVVSLYMQHKQLIKKADYPKQISEYLNEVLSDEDAIFVLADNITYYLCKKDVPNKYVHTSLIRRPEHIKSFQVDVQKEFDDLVKLRPQFVVFKYDFIGYAEKFWGGFLDENYTIVNSWNDTYYCFQRNE